MHNFSLLFYWDSCVFLSYINGDTDRLPIIDNFFEKTEQSKGKIKIITSVISKVEVAFATTEKESEILNSDIENKIDLLWSDDSVLEIVELHDEISSFARKIIRQALTQGWALKPIDAIHLASAKWLGVKEFHTFDSPLKKYSHIIGCKICEPYISQPSLPM